MSSRVSVNMLRTRRKDNNVKPNRRDFRAGRLDRKSSRGMIYENEELRLRTININAEIERGQYDIKKLKRENELLKKEIWCLRDEYEKLDKLLKDREIEFSSSSTTTSSDSDSCSSCHEDDREDPPDDNGGLLGSIDDDEDCQKSNHKILNRGDFEALSVVPEESDTTSILDEQLSPSSHDNDVLQADQSYPCYAKNAICRSTSKRHLFSSEPMLTTTKTCDDVYDTDNDNGDGGATNALRSNELYGNARAHGFCQKTTTTTTAGGDLYRNMVLVPNNNNTNGNGCEKLDKGAIDVLVKMDNKNFASAHPNGAGEGYVDGFKDDFPRFYGDLGTANSRSTFSNGGNLEELLNDIETISQDILAMSTTNTNNQNDYFSNRRCKSDINPTNGLLVSGQDEKPFKSELNVTLMPQPMALIGLEKYKDIQRCIMDTTPSKSLENLSICRQDSPYFKEEDKQSLTDKRVFNFLRQHSKNLPNFETTPQTPISEGVSSPSSPNVNVTLPNYLSTLKDNYVNADYFARCRSENCKAVVDHKANKEGLKEHTTKFIKQQSSSENDENVKIRTTTLEDEVTKNENERTNPENSEDLCSNEKVKETKQKKSLRKKVSIHFRGKKEKQKQKTLETPLTSKNSPLQDKKQPELKITDNDNNRTENKTEKGKINNVNQKITSSRDYNRTNSESDTKNNNPDTKKQQKSSSVSPDRRKHKEDKKCNKKQHKKDRMKTRRATVTSLESRDNRARSHSVGTDRSNTYGGNNFPYDDYMISERDSMSSCETLKTRQINFSNIPIGGKVPWCGCWGNGCI